MGGELLDLVLDNVTLLEGVVHPLADVLLELLVVQAADAELAVNTGGLGGADHTTGDDDADIADATDIGVQPVLVALLRGESGGKSFGRGVDHGLGDVDCARQDGAETDTREDVHVVALAGLEGLALVLQSGEG